MDGRQIERDAVEPKIIRKRKDRQMHRQKKRENGKCERVLRGSVAICGRTCRLTVATRRQRAANGQGKRCNQKGKRKKEEENDEKLLCSIWLRDARDMSRVGELEAVEGNDTRNT